MKSDPKFDHGFHASIPRMVRTGYPDLSGTQKWLYVCLKDLAGETGICFRALRTLEQETGISTGMLSVSIHKLHDAGLIHAEKKKRSAGGKEVWHITIVDIWTANGKAHPTKKVQGEHSEPECSHSEQTAKNVHCVNENVLSENKTIGECSHSKRECSHSETEEGREKKDHFEEGKEKKAITTPDGHTPATVSSLSLSQEKASSLAETLTDEQADFWTRWQAIAGADSVMNDTAYKHVVTLAESVTSTTALQSLYTLSYDRLKDLASTSGKEAVPPRLGNLVKCLPEWEQAQKRRTQEQEQERAAHGHVPGTGTVANLTTERIKGGDVPQLTYVRLPQKPRGGIRRAERHATPSDYSNL